MAQVYPVLLSEEMRELEGAAVKLITDFVDQKPPPPEDEGDAQAAAMYRAAMQQAADNACSLLATLCTKRPPLVERLWQVFAEDGQDEDVKVCSGAAPCAAGHAAQQAAGAHSALGGGVAGVRVRPGTTVQTRGRGVSGALYRGGFDRIRCRVGCVWTERSALIGGLGRGCLEGVVPGGSCSGCGVRCGSVAVNALVRAGPVNSCSEAATGNGCEWL